VYIICESIARKIKIKKQRLKETGYFKNSGFRCVKHNSRETEKNKYNLWTS
jgi:hypothetical protein